MRKRLLFLFLLFDCYVGQSQIVINAQLPSAGMVQKDQLWNLVLVNNTSADINAKVLLNLQDAATGQTVLSGSTSSFVFGKGLKLLESSDIQPVQYTYASTSPASTYLPLGSYNACYSVYKNQADASEKLAEECVRINIAPLNPPQLITPLDKSTLSTGFPQFTWIGPAPLDMFSDLNFEFKIAEVLAGQSPAQAVLYNSPIYTKNNSRVTYENYPETYSTLEKGKTYAWQITARNGQSYAANTEVWSFAIAADSGAVKAANTNYVSLRDNKNEAGHVFVTDSLFIKYYSFDKDHETTVRFFSSDGKPMGTKKQQVRYGDNYLQFRLGSSFEADRLYMIEILDLQNRSFVSFFSIKQPN